VLSSEDSSWPISYDKTDLEGTFETAKLNVRHKIVNSGNNELFHVDYVTI
jgi:hypothetical protein